MYILLIRQSIYELLPFLCCIVESIFIVRALNDKYSSFHRVIPAGWKSSMRRHNIPIS